MRILKDSFKFAICVFPSMLEKNEFRFDSKWKCDTTANIGYIFQWLDDNNNN